MEIINRIPDTPESLVESMTQQPNDIIDELAYYKNYYKKQMSYITTWNKDNRDKIRIYQRNYYNDVLKDKPGFKDGLKSEHRKTIVSECYYRNKDRHKTEKDEYNLLNNITVKARGRPRKVINVIVSTLPERNEINKIVSQNEIN
jgi:hypothetical protein